MFKPFFKAPKKEFFQTLKNYPEILKIKKKKKATSGHEEFVQERRGPRAHKCEINKVK